MLPSMPDSDPANLIADLRTLLDVSRRLGATTELNPLLQQIMAAANAVLGCERTTVFLYDARKHELYSQLPTEAGYIRFSADKGIAGESLRTGSIISVADAYTDDRFNRDIDRRTGFRTRNLLTFPLRNHEDAIVGVLQVLNKRDGHFTERDEELALTLSSLAGVAVQRQLLINEFAEKQKLERDLALAREIQQSTLPQQLPAVPGYDIAGFNQPADATGGDSYDCVPLTGGRVALMIADATGHGIGPALVISQYRAMIQALLAMGEDIVAIMQRINALLERDVPEGMFVTGFLGVLDPQAGVIEYVSAGHGPLLHHRRAGDTCVERHATTVPLAILSPLECGGCERIELAPGDTFLLVTDGFFEWMNAGGEQFGTQRVFEVVRRHPDCSAGELIHHIQDALGSFASGTRQHDDLTALVVRRKAD
jgi:sigma-B regulation protein RsbU (phosphoserine phosphatase)